MAILIQTLKMLKNCIPLERVMNCQNHSWILYFLTLNINTHDYVIRARCLSLFV
jgi:hypothetical protein